MRIAVLEDEPDQMSLLVDMLEYRLIIVEEPVICVPFENGEALRLALRTDSFDLLVLDWNVPGLDGLELLTWLRRQKESNVPVVMLSSRSSEEDAVRALDLGADDYVRKPVRPQELAARIRRVLTPKRIRALGSRECFGTWTFDHASSSVEIGAGGGQSMQRVALSASEFHMALTLFRNIGRPVSRVHLLEGVGREADAPSRALDSQIYRLRTKLGLQASRGLRLQTVYGQGYRLAEVSTEEVALG